MGTRIDFDRETLPWLDRVYAEIDAYVDHLGDETPEYDLREYLIRWTRDGYAIFPGLIESDLIDAFVEDIAELATVRAISNLLLNIEGYGTRKASEFPAEAFDQHHSRLMDFHNLSEAGKRLSLHPGIVNFLTHVFRAPIVAMQSLTFVYSTEQSTHQDFPYVTAGIMSHLAATWIALEDVDPAAGPLFYHVGSHTVRKFDWGNGPALTPDSNGNEHDFAVHLESECETRNYPYTTFCPKKGDVLFWHAGLVHGGSVVDDGSLTRRSFVTHYSTEQAYPLDRRTPDEAPWRIELNGGCVYGDQRNPQEEDRFKLGRSKPDR